MVRLIKKHFGLTILTIGILSFFSYQLSKKYYLRSYYNNPKVKDVYLFNIEDKFEPYYLDSIDESLLYFFSHKYDYKNGLPDHQQILNDSFNNNIYYIYTKSELLKLYNQNKIIKIYR